jgi:hypothetical protein
MMRIHIGILDRKPGWQLLLTQEGIPHSVVQTPEEAAGCSVMVAGDECPASMIDVLKDFLRRGGGVLCSGMLFEKLSGTPTAKKFIRWLLPEPDSQFLEAGMTDIFLNSQIPDGANTVVDEGGKYCILNREFGGGHIVAFPFDPASVIIDQRRLTKSFYASRSRLPYERVSAVTKNSVRLLVGRALEILHHKRGFPYAHLWYYPDKVQSVAAFRVDTDFAGQKELEEVSFASESHGKSFTWFVDVRSQEKYFHFYRQLKNQEIGLHCFDHKRYTDARDAFRDLSGGMAALRESGFTVSACALPYGQWSIELGRVIEKIGMTCSSEFSYDADNFPSAPYLNDRFSEVLQVPIHPVSIGNLSRQGFAEEEMMAYYTSVIDRKIRSREPIILYHHPKNGHSGVITSILSRLGKSEVRWMTMIGYADWWRRRNLSRFSIEFVDKHCHLQSGESLEGMGLHITRDNNTEAFLVDEPLLDMQKVEWQSRVGPLPLPGDIRKIRKFNPWIPLQQVEDTVFRTLKF